MSKAGVQTPSYDWHDPMASQYERIQLKFENGVYKDMSKSVVPPNG